MPSKLNRLSQNASFFTVRLLHYPSPTTGLGKFRTNPLAIADHLWFKAGMNRRPLAILLLLLVIALVVLIVTRLLTPLVPLTTKPDAAIPATPETPVAAPVPTAPPPQPAPINPAATLRTPEEELQQVSFSIESFRKSLGSNPVGANEEITRSLLGDNEKKLQVGLPDGVAQNAAGEMVDRWGTPYFFHQQSATEMEIRSAGPDRKLWTDDDLQIK